MRNEEFFADSDHPLAELYRKRVDANRDLVVLITDSSNDRGTGKTTLALQLANGMDRTDEGLTSEKLAIDPRPLTTAYTELPRGSSLVLDESEVGVDKYRAGSSVNKAIRELVSMGRIQEKYLVLNAPADHLVDKDLKSLVDVWILVERRGYARVYRMDWNPHQGHEMTHKMGVLNWSAIPKRSNLNTVYKELTEEKNKRLNGEEGDGYIERDEAQDMVENAIEETERELRDRYIRDMYDFNLPQSDIAEIVGLSPGRVSQIVNADGD